MSRKICKEIKLSEDEKDIISQCAEKHKKRLGTYIRETAVDGKIKIYDLRQFDNLIMSFNRIGNEINPIAKVINSTGTITKKDIEDLKNFVADLKAVFENYLLPLTFDFFDNGQIFYRKEGNYEKGRYQNSKGHDTYSR